ncbi:MAG: hypothetical protein ACLUEQ_11905 [Cloacibacillus evryensis]
MINMGHGVMICRRIMGWKNIHRRCFKKILAMGLFKAVGKAVSVRPIEKSTAPSGVEERNSSKEENPA